MRASSTGAEPTTQRTSSRASISRSVKWLGQDLSMPSVPGRTLWLRRAMGSSVSSNSLRGASTLPERAKRRLANSRASPLLCTYSASMRSPGRTHVPVR